MSRTLRLGVVLLSLFSATFLLKASLPQVSTGVWQAAGSLATARSGAAAVALPDGRILITGGSDGSGAPMSSAELFNRDGTFSSAAGMKAARSGHSALVLPDGRVLVTGGRTSGGGITNSAETYDPQTNAWQMLSATMVEARAGHSISQLLNGDVLLAGGESSGGPVSALELFDETNDTFSSAGALLTARRDHAAAVLSDGRVLIAGGTGVDASGNPTTLSSTEIYDGGTGAVTAGPALATARAKLSATTLLDGTVALVGGNDGSNDLASIEIYDAAAGTIVASPASLTTARSGHQALLLPHNGSVLVVGGTSAGTELASAELFAPWNTAVQATGAMASARTGAAGAPLSTVDGLLLVAGGQNASTGTLASGELYGFATVKTDQSDYAPGTTVNITGSGWQPGETVTLTLVESPNIDTHPPMTAVADQNGNISNSQFSPDSHDLDVRFYLTAAGAQSQAQTTFTDAQVLKNYQASISPTTDTAGHTTSYSITIANCTDALCGSGKSSDSSQQIGSAQVHVPTAYSRVSVPATVTASNGSTWSVSLSSGVISLQTTGAGKLNPGASVSFTATANAACTAGNYVWNTNSDNNTTPGGSSFGLIGLQPSVSVSGSCDSTPPTTTAVPNPASNANGWWNTNVSVSLTATDNSGGSGVKQITYSATGAQPISSTVIAGASASVGPITAEGTTTISYFASDNAGNVEATRTITIKLDTTSPDTTISNSPSNPSKDASPSFTFTGTDNLSAPTDLTFECNLDGAGFSSCSDPKSYSNLSDGSHTFQVRATDLAGNVDGSPASYTWTIKTTAPAVIVSFTPDGSNGWFKTSPAVGSVTANDASNVSAINCTIDGTPATLSGVTGLNSTNATAQLSVAGEGSHSVSCTATDSLGNAGAGAGSNGTATVKIDSVKPSLTASRQTVANGNGWNNSDVTVRFVCTDSTSGVASLGASGAATGNSAASPLDVTVTTEGLNQTVTGSCTDAAGNTATPASLSGINIDKTKPVITGSRTPAANAFGWNNTDVTVGFTCADSGTGQSGIDTNSVTDAVVSTEGQNQSVTNTGACTDKAGNVADAATVDKINIDKTPPNPPTVNPSPVPNAAGWNNTDVTVGFTSAGDAGAVQSGIESCTSSSALSAETAGTDVSGTCTDKAGNVSTPAKVTVKIDKTKPVITGSRLPSANSYGWNNTDVAVSFACADTGPVQSAVGTNTVEGSTVTAEGQSLSVTNTGSCVDIAGNSADPATVSGINIDKAKPTATAAASPGPNPFGWNNSDVTVTFTGADGLSGIAHCDSPVTLISEGTNLSATGTCTDKADNVSDPATAAGINIDKTKPVITGSRLPLANSYGWNNTDVTVSFSCSDTGTVQSGPDANSSIAGAMVSTEGANQSVTNTGTCIDKAGNTAASVTVTGISIDKTNPTITLTITPSNPAATGWYNGTTGKPTVHFACVDNLSGYVSCPADVPVPEGGNQTISGSVSDKAGNSAIVSTGVINVDVTPPMINLVAPASNANYLLNQSVAANYTCSDTGSSGLASCSGTVANGALITTGTVGVKSFSVTATDVAGNSLNQSATYGVTYQSGGVCYGDAGHQILQPINADGTSTFKQGSTVPAKFRVCDALGNSIGTPGVVSSFNLIGAVNGTVTAQVDETVVSTTPDTSFRWDSTGQQWIFNISTKNLSTHSTYVYKIILNDGSPITFQYGLPK